MRTLFFPFHLRGARIARAAVLLLILPCAGCAFYRSIGNGQHLETGRLAPHHDVSQKGKEILVEVTTDASGAVADIIIQKSSGSEAVDNYVATTIRSGWPAIPSTRSVARLRHTPNGGFSDPEILSNTPVP